MIQEIITQPRIETISQKNLIGKRLTMSFANNQTYQLWKSFMPRRKEIENALTSNLFSIQVYPEAFDFSNVDINATFEKWSAVEVEDFSHVPVEMESFVLPGGLYAVFDYKGLSTDTKIFQYIFGEWLPLSKEYELDERPHFEILGDKYKNNDPDSEEEIWIPIKPK